MVGLVGYFDIKEYSDMVETQMTDDCDVESHEETVCGIREKESCKLIFGRKNNTYNIFFLCHKFG